nr:WYL domain-containing protein [Corynebacterium sp. TAE3-ERU12]
MAGSATFADRSLSRVGSRGWAKIAGLRGREDLKNADSAVVVADNSLLTGADLDAIIAARLFGQRIRFWYTPQVGDNDQQRLLEPWRLFPHDGKLYLIGWDVHRKGPRTFRLSRMCEVTTSADDLAVHGDPGAAEMRRLAEQSLFGEFTDGPVVIDVVPGTCGDIVRTARDCGDGRWELPEMPIREATNMALEHAGDLVIVEPVAVREHVIAQLREVVAAYKEPADG